MSFYRAGTLASYDCGWAAGAELIVGVDWTPLLAMAMFDVRLLTRCGILSQVGTVTWDSTLLLNAATSTPYGNSAGKSVLYGWQAAESGGISAC